MTDMQGKVVLITGASNGIGRAAALALARTGATVALAGRDEKRVDATVAMIREQSDNDEVRGLLADLSTLDATVRHAPSGMRQLAQEFRRRYSRLDVLLNNAGAAYHERAETVDGIERTFALNHLAYYQLSRRLLDMLQASAPARIVNVSSDAHRQVKALDFDNIDGRKAWGLRGFTPLRAVQTGQPPLHARAGAAPGGQRRDGQRAASGGGRDGYIPRYRRADRLRLRHPGAALHEEAGTGRRHPGVAGDGGRGRADQRRLLRESPAARAFGGGARRRRGAASVGAQRGVVRAVGGLRPSEQSQPGMLWAC